MPLSSPSTLQFPQIIPTTTTPSSPVIFSQSLTGQSSSHGLNNAIDVFGGKNLNMMAATTLSPSSLITNGGQSWETSKLIAEASQELLVQCGNLAYSNLYNAHKVLKQEFLMLQTSYQDSLKKNEKLLVERKMLDDILATILNKVVLRDDGILTPPGHYKFENPITLLYSILDGAKECQELHREDFPNIKYWNSKKWEQLKHRKNGITNLPDNNDQSNDKNDIPEELQYLEDTNGNTISVSRLSEVRTWSRAVWQSLLNAGKAPMKWGEVDAETFEYFSREMRRKYVEFRLCSGDWKAQQYALGHYADWYRNHVRMKQNGDSDIKPKTTTSRKRQRSITSDNEVNSPSRHRALKSKFNTNDTNGIPIAAQQLFTLAQLPKLADTTSSAKKEDVMGSVIVEYTNRYDADSLPSKNKSSSSTTVQSNIGMPTETSVVQAAPLRSSEIVVFDPFAMIQFPPQPTSPKEMSKLQVTEVHPTSVESKSKLPEPHPHSFTPQSPLAVSAFPNQDPSEAHNKTFDIRDGGIETGFIGGNDHGSASDVTVNDHPYPQQTNLKQNAKSTNPARSEPLQLPTENPNTAKNLAISEWLHQHPEGSSKSDFEGYWRGLSADEKKQFQQRSAILKRAEKKKASN